MNEERMNGTESGAERSLSDLFARARKDTRNLVLTRERATEIIHSEETTVLHRLAWRTSLGRRLLSSPIRIGVTLMTTSAFASIMAIAISQFTSSAPPSIPVQKSAATPRMEYSQPAPSQHVESQVVVIRPALNATVRSSEPARPDQLPFDFGAAKATDSDTLHAIELNPDQLARLGVELPDNGDIVVYYPNAKREAKSWRFTTRGQLSQGRGEPTNHTINIQPLPYAITYPMGEALMYSRFAPNGQAPDVLIGMTPGVSNKYSARYAELRGDDPRKQTSFGISTDANTSDSGHIQTKIVAEVQTNNSSNGPALIIQPGLPGLRIDDDMPPPPPPLLTQRDPRATGDTSWKPGVSRVKVTSKITVQSDRSSGGTMKFTADTLVSPGDGSFQLRGNVHGTVADSGVSIMVTTNADEDATDNSNGPTKHLQIVSKVVVDSGLAVRADTSVTVKKYVAGISIPKFPLQIKARRGAPITPDTDAQDFEHFYRKNSGDTTQWSSLIPVRVTNYNTPEHHTLIFWYERTPEVLNIVPRSAVEKQDARPKNVEISVYPNPTNGETNVHYVVKNGQPISINVVSLLGHKLIEGGKREDQHGDMTLNLSTLDPGVYLLVATLDNGEKAVERVVVTK